MVVYLTYDGSQSIEYCFWKYFFKTIGVWVEENRLFEDSEIDYSNTPQLVLINNELEHHISDYIYDKIVYVLKDPTLERKDIVQPNYDGYKRDILTKLFENTSYEEWELGTLNKLLEIFHSKNKDSLWAASWLIHEISYTDTSQYQEILQMCNNILHSLMQSQEIQKATFHYKYMKLYCEYVRCSAKLKIDLSLGVLDVKDCFRVLQKVKDMIYATNINYHQRAMLDILAGNICLSTPNRKEFAISYYESALKYVKSSHILYMIGNIYAYHNNSKAINYYQKAYNCDEKNFMALYRFALALERKEKYIEAVSIYSKIDKILRQLHLYNSISINYLEYDYKVCRKHVLICDKYIAADNMLKLFQNKVNDIENNLEKHINFSSLMKAIFGEEHGEKKTKMIMEEVRLKIESYS